MTNDTNLILCHIGKNKLPEYIYDCIYQFQLFNNKSDINYYLLTENSLIPRIEKHLKSMNINIEINIISLDSIIKKDTTDNFWINTTLRFNYICEFMKQKNLSNVFHIENDVMLYRDLHELNNLLIEKKFNNLTVVQDSETRAICSIVYIPEYRCLEKFITYKEIYCKTDRNANDMYLMGAFKDKLTFHDYNNLIDTLDSDLGIFDGACIGQYLGGIDPRNIQKIGEKEDIDKAIELCDYNNPSKNFVNETSIFKPDTVNFEYIIENGHKKYFMKTNHSYSESNIINAYFINNLHIHSKQLYLFSSVFDIEFDDIISGEKIINLCDITITNNYLIDYHKNIKNYTKILININDETEIINDNITNTIIKIFVYPHILDLFINDIFPNLNSDKQYIIYIHNSDYGAKEILNKHNNELFLNNPKLYRVYCQNTDIIHDKIYFLPIGIANSMFAHGNLKILYKTMIKTYYNKKSKNLYINLKENTHPYRVIFKNYIKKSNLFEMTPSNKNYNEYLNELQNHYFCMCIRGNGIDTHRFWESLYLGTIPVIINNSETNLSNWVYYLKKNNIVFYEINNLEEINDLKFDKQMYDNILNKYEIKSLFNQKFLKLNNYT